MRFGKDKTRTKTVFPNRDSKQFKFFQWTQHSFVEAIVERLHVEKDAFILVTGDTGAGKSHFVGGLCFRLFRNIDNFVTGEGKMFKKENFIVDPEEFAVKMITEQGSVLWIDEGRDAVNRQKWFSEINQTVAGRKNRNRKNFNVYFLCMPYEREIDPKMASHLCLWLWVRRGVIEVYCKMSGKKGGTGLDIQKILDREEKYMKENPKANVIIPTIHPEFLGRIYFNALSKGFKREYDDLVEKKKAVGELSDEEKEKYGIIVTKSDEQIINEAVAEIKNGKFKNKRELFTHLKEKVELPEEKMITKLNFYLDMEGLPTFRKLFDKKKIQQEDLFE